MIELYHVKVLILKKTSASKESIICHYWHFLDKRFKFQLDVSTWCHDVSMMYMNLSNIAISNTHSVDYRCIINGIRTSEAVKLQQKADLKVQSCRLKKH